MTSDGSTWNGRPVLWRRLSFALLSLLVLYAGVLIIAGRVVAGSAPLDVNSPADCEWTIIPSVNSEAYNVFHGVAPVSANDIWAVGSKGPGNFGQLTLIEHWDGTSWSTATSPSPGNNQNELEDVVALSSNDVWAAGYINQFSGSSAESLFLHWDGATWSRVASPNPGNFRNNIYGLTVLAPDDVWAVGYSWPSGSRHRTMIFHWDGSVWSVVPSPNVGTFDNHLFAVNALAPDNVWAVGHYMDSSGTWQTLTLHWDGSAWSVVPSPNVPSTHNHLMSISMLSGSDGWAVGYTCTPSDCFGGNFGTLTEQLLILRWDGIALSIVPNPDLDADFAFFKDVVALSSNNAWAVGSYGTNDMPKTLIMHWDGSSWNLVPSPDPSPSCCPMLDAIISLPGGDMWAVGDYHFPDHIVFRTLAQYYPASCGATATPTSAPTNTPTRTSTSILATGTPLVSTATSTAIATSTPIPTSASTGTPTAPVPTQTPTACVVLFSDVPEGSTFYPFVRCLACRGILGGYEDGTFRPSNSVTRAQLAKIVSNAAGWADVPSEQTFGDVPPGHTFYLFIERIASRGIMSGYPCGGSGEPCGPGNSPYFRPGVTSTRGQIAKVVSNAAGLGGDPGGQLFEDVPPAHTFHLWVQRLAAQGVMSGYPCGGPGEPCVAPTNRPYFRPSGATTRAQTAKIVANAFFPNCAPPRP
ncbi:MAG: S-layer homology domain-containing protein [Chloroflexia bacterium]